METNNKPLLTQELIEAVSHQARPLAFVTGVFDLLHEGHMYFLRSAKQKINKLEGSLIIGVESDKRVKMLKGEQRPLINQEVRKQQLEQTGLPNLVFILPESFYLEWARRTLLSQINPDYLYVSSTSPNLIKKRQLIEQSGGKLEVICNHLSGYSTTNIIKMRKITEDKL